MTDLELAALYRENPGIARCMDVLLDFLRMPPPSPRGIRDEQTNELFERQADNSYKAAYRLLPIG